MCIVCMHINCILYLYVLIVYDHAVELVSPHTVCLHALSVYAKGVKMNCLRLFVI